MLKSRAEKLSVGVARERIETRFFTEKDRGALQEIYFESRKSAFDWLDNFSFKKNNFDRDTDGECIWVATVKDKPVGFISAWEPENFIHNLFVHPSNIGMGVGSVLLHVCLEKIGRPASLKCLEKNIGARNFYLSKGWKIVSSCNGPDGQYQLMQFDKK